MRYILTLFLVVVFSHAYAGDTLTRAQIYNFNVGDTFDYRIYNWYQGPGPPSGNISSSTTISYSRYIVTNIYWSADTQTKYIVQTEVYPSPITIDTLVLTNLNGYEVIIDSARVDGVLDTIAVSGLPSYFGRRTNYIWYPFPYNDPQMEEKLFANGLGVVIDYIYGGALSMSWIDSTVLIYNSGDSGTYGTPYTDYHDTSYTTSIPDMSANLSLKLYPTLNNGTFTIVTQDGSQLPFDLNIYDLEGRKVSQLSINDKRKVIELPELSSGSYIWKVSNNGSTFGAGKMIIEK